MSLRAALSSAGLLVLLCLLAPARALAQASPAAADGLPAERSAASDLAGPPNPPLASGDAGSDLPALAPPVASGPVQILVMLQAPAPHAHLDGAYTARYAEGTRQPAQERLAARLAAAHGLTMQSRWAMPLLGVDCIVMELPDGMPVAETLAALAEHAEVAWAQPLNLFQTLGHADPLFALQPNASQWQLDALHAVATGKKVEVALIDSGVDGNHPDLLRQIAHRENFVDGRPDAAEQHGTAVAGLIAARADNGVGIVGVAPDATLMALRACWQTEKQTLCDSLSLAKALQFAIEHHAEIINMSLSGPDDLLLGRLIDIALSQRRQVVAAVDPRVASGGFPADHPGVTAVTDAQAAPRSQPANAWAAPARDIPAPLPGGGWRLVSGSSYAAAQVSGLLAVVQQARRERGSDPPGVPRLVRAADGGIDACASLGLPDTRQAAVPSGGPLAACRVALGGALSSPARR